MNLWPISFLWDISKINLQQLPEPCEREFPQMKDIYEKFIEDLRFSCNTPTQSILIQIPEENIKGFTIIAQKKQQDPNSFFFHKEIQLISHSTQSLWSINERQHKIEQDYERVLQLIPKYDKFIEVYGTKKDIWLFCNNKEDAEVLERLDRNFRNESIKISITYKKPRLKLYFPSLDQAETEWKSLSEFYDLFLQTLQMDWNRIQECNQELVELFTQYDEVAIIGSSVDIIFDISNKWARNSVIETNYPGSEVFTAPNKHGVEGWIEYNNDVFIPFLGVVIKKCIFSFKKGKLVSLEIFEIDANTTDENLEAIKQKIYQKISEKPWNSYVGELAFGTNFFAPVGTRHTLLWEKAFGMHFALGKSYTYPQVDNWNHDTSIHIDFVRDMRDDSKVYFKKKSWEELLVMEGWNFTQRALPKIYNYYNEVFSKK